MIRALIFDFDGTILDTETPIYQSWEEVFDTYGLQLSLEKWVANIGTAEETFYPMDELEKQYGRPLDRHGIEQARRQRELALILSEPALPGAEAYLRDARRLGLKIGLATSSSCDWVISHITRLGMLDYFEVINAGDDVHCTKPDPALYMKTLHELGAKGQEGLAIEDSPNGILAAKRAGMYCVAVPNPMTRLLPIDHADLRLDSLTEMPLEELLRRIDGQSV